jgi:hypothetical protein
VCRGGLVGYTAPCSRRRAMRAPPGEGEKGDLQEAGRRGREALSPRPVTDFLIFAHVEASTPPLRGGVEAGARLGAGRKVWQRNKKNKIRREKANGRGVPSHPLFLSIPVPCRSPDGDGSRKSWGRGRCAGAWCGEGCAGDEQRVGQRPQRSKERFCPGRFLSSSFFILIPVSFSSRHDPRRARSSPSSTPCCPPTRRTTPSPS